MKFIMWKKFRLLRRMALALVLAWAALGFRPTISRAQERPNIVFILTDNQSPSTLGCYGNDEISTPNIDRLAAQGIRFENAFACNGMCSPSRATIMTALMPSQHGIHTQLSDQLKKEWPKNWCAVDEFRTLPKTLAEDGGYETALIGKWHLGNPYQSQLGFDYWVTFPEGHTLDWYNNDIIDNGTQYKCPGHITDFWTEKAVEYLNNRSGEKPFFLYLAYDAPYGLPPSITGKAENRFAGLYEGKEMNSSPRAGLNKMLEKYVREGPEHYKSLAGIGHNKWAATLILTLNDPESMRNFASQISLVDDGVGRLLDTLKLNGLDKNTLVILSSDQGLAYGQKGLWGQTENTYPSNLYDTPLRIPLIFRHTGRIPVLQETGLLVSDYDIFSTILSYVGLSSIDIANTPGLSFAPLLEGKKLCWKEHDAVFMEQEESRAVRTLEWKYVERCPQFIQEFGSSRSGLDAFEKMIQKKYPHAADKIVKLFQNKLTGDELYNLKDDPEELVNLAGDSEYADIQKKLAERLKDFFDRYADPQYDLWKGGTVKSNSNVPFIWKKLTPGWKPVMKEVTHPFSDKE